MNLGCNWPPANHAWPKGPIRFKSAVKFTTRNDTLISFFNRNFVNHAPEILPFKAVGRGPGPVLKAYIFHHVGQERHDLAVVLVNNEGPILVAQVARDEKQPVCIKAV